MTSPELAVVRTAYSQSELKRPLFVLSKLDQKRLAWALN